MKDVYILAIESSCDETSASIVKNGKEDLHELLGGRNRNNSMKYGLVLPVCREHHDEIQHSIKYKKVAQKKFQEVYPEVDFVDIFKINYL